jgi:hypothetical protein
VAAGDVEQAIAAPHPCELERAPGRGLAAGVQLVPEQPAHGWVLVDPRAAALARSIVAHVGE